jgi:alkanesulfonate monooxygenase SsuD/methylene tetrahydromethanopterin reductase-like flavin-dependent oxidoreductase (luciferase family)
MKLFAFEEITYPGLPRNLGPEVRITNRYCDPQLVVQHYREHLEELAWAEDYGFDGIFVNEHHFHRLQPQPDRKIGIGARGANCRRYSRAVASFAIQSKMSVSATLYVSIGISYPQ